VIAPRHSKEEFARRGDEIYEREIVSRFGPDDEGKFVVIDIETGAYEVDRDEIAASDRLLARLPDAQVWLRRVGSHYARRFGQRQRAETA
jgi:ABC-type branched-subunit amino acid transport system ATPase component